MSKLAQFREIERQLQELLSKQEALQKSDELKKDLEFADKLNALINEYGKSPTQVVEIIAPELVVRQSQEKTTRRPRATKVYTNPHNGEVIETKGGNHKQLKAWKEQYGADVVESWAVVA